MKTSVKIAGLMLGLPLLASAAQFDVREFKLDNGLKVLVKEDHRRVVVSQVWYKVGSSYEHDGITGISHMLEHMMFKGTDQHPAGEFSRIISANGGRENAFTGDDYTAYFQSLEKSRLEVSFELEADRMRHLKLDQGEFAKEREVVLEERRMRTDDQPRAKTSEQFMAMAFSNGPYKNPVIGWPEDIKGYQLGDLQNWYGLWYAPNNATVVVVGDVQPEAVFALAQKHFGGLAPSQLPELKARTEMDQAGLRRMTVKRPAKLPFLVMGYKVPVLKGAAEEWEPYALEVLSGILDGGNGARLASRLVRGKQIAAETGVGYDLYSRLPTLFTLEAVPVQGRTTAELEKALRDEIRQLQDKPVAEEEMARVKAQVVAHKVYEQDSGFYQAMQLGMLETVGLGWPKAEEYLNKVKAVTAEQVQAVARKYLVEDRLSIAYLDPLPIADNKSVSETLPEGGHVR
ncbi:M16 family metallopeptidase [Methylogaea oryzae]|uniref:M16 family metallopeptidase n=1 Tax=Methylogaea oryzae TaxID=1295382 RepID=UPI0006D0FE24|nr:pitrilysin family protein [Methylogaea oryzae]